MKPKERSPKAKSRSFKIDLIGLSDQILNRLYTISPKIAILLNNIIVYLLLSIKLYKRGRLVIGIPDYVACSVILFILTPFAYYDLITIRLSIIVRCVCG